jgi:hypothetical protein
MDVGLTTLREEDIAAYLATAQSLTQRTNVTVADEAARNRPEIAGTGRRFVSTVSTGAVKRTVDVRIFDKISAITPDDSMMSVAQHGLAYRLRRGLAVGLAVRDVFARRTELEGLAERNKGSALSGDDATLYHELQGASAFVALFAAASYLAQTVDGEAESNQDPSEPQFDFDTPQDGYKAFLYGLDQTIDGAPDDSQMVARAKAFTQATLEGLLARRARFPRLAAFDDVHIRLDADDFSLIGFDIQSRTARKPLVMTFKKPHEVVGNHIAKYQAIKLSKMLMAYDFDREMNPFVELGGFLFSFIGDGFPGTGKTTLIQMIAGLIKDYCDVAGYGFHYENFGVDQVSSYQGKSGQNCKQFITNVMDPRVIGFGTVDDIDQVAAKRSDDRASAGQHEITAVLMESLSGTGTVVRGNCCFGMFSNYPENVDDALRQRAGARWLVDGPQTEDDYIDIFALLVGDNHAIPLGDHDLYVAQEIKRAIETAYETHDRPEEEALAKIYDREIGAGGDFKSMADIGRYLHAIKQGEPRFTGRAIKNITDAMKMRAMDIELPDAWFETPEPFLHKPYDEKIAMIAEMRGPITLEMMIQEINRYADSEFRYTNKSDDAGVADLVRGQRLRERAAGEIETLKKEGRWNA